MQIRVKLMGLLKDKTPADGCLELENDATIEEALARLEIPAEKAQAFTVNGSFERDRNRRLSDGDELSVIPPVGGG